MSSLIINTLELAAPQAPTERERKAGLLTDQAQEQQNPPSLRPEDVERIQHHFLNRRLRLWAD